MIEAGSELLHYRLVEKIGEGAMGVVWKAVDTTLDREVAIKILPEAFAADPERVARFDREAKVVASLNHPYIAGVHSVHVEDGLRFISMELVSGEDLAGVLGRGRMPRDEAIRVAIQITRALEAAHARGVVHRDLKPANVKLDAEGDAKVLDFGLARALETASGLGEEASSALSPTLTFGGTAAGMILGTASYMSPEQARGKPADRRSDIWSFGCVLFEMLAGHRPFGGETVSDTLASVLTSEPDFGALPEDTPAAIRRLLRRCLNKEPHHRLHDAADARILLEEIASGEFEDVGVQRAGSESVVSRRSFLLMTAVAIAAAVLAIVIASMLPLSEPTQEPTVVFPLPAPGGTRLEQVSVSPDGARFAFLAESGSGVTEIWIRDLAVRKIRKLEGTEGARDLFWSPDSRFVGYFTPEHLWKVDAATGDAVKLAAIDQKRGADWNEGGMIVIGGASLATVSASGGEVANRVERDLESGENAMRYPSFLPDGKNVLFYSRNAESPDLAGLWIVELDSGTRKHLSSSATSSAIYVESGQLLYRRDRYLVARPFDTSTLEFTGDYEIVDEDLWFEPGVTAQIDVSASRTGTLTYRTGGPELAELAVFDREGIRLDTLWEPKSFLTIALAPSGQELLTSFPGRGVERKPWLYDLRTASARQLEAPGDQAGNAVFSEDGGRALLGLYVDALLGSWMTELASGVLPQELKPKHASGLRGARPYDWHLDRIVYEGGDEGARSLNVLDLSNGDDRTIVKGPGVVSFGAVSPDGRWMAYSSNETGQWDIYVTSFPDGERRWRVSTAGGHQPRWNPRGGELFFLSSDRRMMSVLTRGEDTFQWDAPRELFQTAIVDLGPHRGCWGYAVLPDGERFLILTRQEQSATPAVAVLNWR